MAADVEGVERKLEELHRLSREGFSDVEINDPATLVENLGSAVLALDPHVPGNEADVALFASFVFDSQAPRDLLSFATSTMNTPAKVTKKARMAAIKVVGDFLKRIGGSLIIDRYALRVKQGLWDVFSKETESQEVRAHALRPLRQLLKLRPASLAAERWEVPAMWNAIKEQYRLGSKVSQGVKGELLKLSGSLMLVHGADVPELAGEVTTVLGWCDSALTKHSENKRLQKAQQPQIVAGAFACIDLVCSAGFEERYAWSAAREGEGRNTTLYKHLVTAVAEGTVEDLTRFEVPAKALRFFRRHAGLFSNNVGPLPRALQLYGYMEKCAIFGGKSSRLKLKKHALPAIESVLRQVSNFAAASGDDSQRNTVYEFEKKYFALLEARRPTSEQTAVALAGLASLSAAATALSSYEEVTNVTDRLLACLDSALVRLDVVAFAEDDSEGEDDIAEPGAEGWGNDDGVALFSRDRSLKLRAQFLRALACRAGVLGGVFAKAGRVAVSHEKRDDTCSAMDVEDDEGGEQEGGGRGKGKQGRAPDGATGAAVPGHVMRRLEEIATRLVQSYELLSRNDRGLACRALAQLWLALAGPGQSDNLSCLLASVVPKGVKRAGLMEEPGNGFGETNSAAVHWVAPVNPITGVADKRLCFAQADLWRRVLDPGADDLEPLQAWSWRKGIQETAVGVVYREVVAPEVYDAVVGSVLTIIKRLDLRYETPEESVRPVALQPVDQQMFLNLVSFCQDLLPTCRADLLLEWAPIVCPELVERSLERPMVSGFYRLMTLMFRAIARAGFFDDRSPPPTASSSEKIDVTDKAWAGRASPGTVEDALSLETTGEGNRDLGASAPSGNLVLEADGGAGGSGRLVCRRVLCRYVEWMAVRISGFQDELLSACTEALLSAPPDLLGGDLGPLVSAVKIALTSGASHLPTAVVAVAALERWNDENPTLLAPYLGEILPHLDTHLLAEASVGGGDAGASEKARRRSKTGKTPKQSDAAVAVAEGRRGSEEATRKDLRNRIVRFLGRLGGMNQLVAADASLILSNSLAWDTKERIVLEVPYKNQKDKLPICLDAVLQRLVELARNEGTRQTKTLAAECLHALVVYMVGCTATDPSSGNRGEPGEYSKLFRRIFPAVLRLAVDLDETTRKLFSTLSMQLVRWFSQAQTENPDTIALLDCLGEGAASEEGEPLREMCAKGIVEFLRYAIKQSTKRQQAEGPVTTDALLSRVFSLVMHPDKNRRLGGLMAFNQLCRPLREETSLVDRYALRLLHVALISLRRAHHDHSALGVVDAAAAAVNRSLRIVRHSVEELGDRADLLRHKDSRGQLGSVQEMAEWAWERVGSVETRFRRKCMAVLQALCPLIVGSLGPGLPSDEAGTRVWVWRRLRASGRDGVTEAVRIFEANNLGPRKSGRSAVCAGSHRGSNLVDPQDEDSADKDELDGAATSADCYKFACETGVITADELFLGDRENVPPFGSDGDDGEDDTGATGAQVAGGQGRTAGKKRSRSREEEEKEEGSAENDSPGGDTRVSRGSPPRVLHMLATIAERFGSFLEGFPFQSLANEDANSSSTMAAESAASRVASNVRGYGGCDRSSTRTLAPPESSSTGLCPRPLVVNDLGLLPTDRAAARLSRAIFLRRTFTLVAECLSSTAREEEMASLIVAEGLWSRGVHLLLAYSLLWPWAGGLLPRPSDGEEVEQFLPAASERLLKHWKILDRAAGRADKFSDTLRGLLRIRVSGDEGEKSSTSIGGGSIRGREVDLCQWLLSRSLSSQEALSRNTSVARSTMIDDVPRQPRESGGRRARAVFASSPEHLLTDEELVGRVLRGYRTFANAGLFDKTIASSISSSSGCGDPLYLSAGLWSSVLNLPEGLRPASEHRANTALRLAIELGLPITTTTNDGSVGIERDGLEKRGSKKVRRTGRETGGGYVVLPRAAEASIVAGVLDVCPAVRATTSGSSCETLPQEGDRQEVGGATRGALFYRRFSEPIHEALLRPSVDGRHTWREACASLVDACLSDGDAGFPGAGTVRAAQAFAVLEGVVTLQTDLRTPAATRCGLMTPRETLAVVVPEFQRLVQHPYWAPPGAGSDSAGKNSPAVTCRMLRESLRLCSRLLRLAAIEKSGRVTTAAGRKTVFKMTPPSPGPYMRELLEMSGVLVAGTLGSSSPLVSPLAKADALALVPFLRPCLTRKAKEYGHDAPRSHSSRSSADRSHSEVEMLPALEEMMSRHFPLEDSREPAQGSEEAKNFALLLRGLLKAFVRCGDLGLLELLFGTLAEGRKHLHYGWVSRALDAFVSGVDVDADGVAEAVFGFCLDKVSEQRVPINVKAALADKVCLPLLELCPVEISRSLYLSTTAGGSFSPGPKSASSSASVLQRLHMVVDRRNKETGKFLSGPLLVSICFALLEALYEMLELDALRALADQAFSKKDALKEVTKGVAKAWKAIKDGRTSDGAADQLRCRRAVFSCVCTVVRATQDQEKHFDALVWSDPLHDPTPVGVDKESVLSLVLDMSKYHAFEVSPPRFQSRRLRPPRPPPLSANRGEGKGGRARLTASFMLSQSSLGVGGESFSGLGGFDQGASGGPLEDSRETYSSQAALTDSASQAVLTDKEHESSSQQDFDSHSQGPSLAPVFGRGAKGIGIFGGVPGGDNGREVEEETESGYDKNGDISLEMSHVNREPCMRSLLLVMQAEIRLFEKVWLDRFERSQRAYEPAWSSGMRAKLADPGLPRNVRLVAFQFALNTPAVEALKPWAKKWVVTMTDFALAPLPEGLRVDGEPGLHYLLRDFAHVLLDETNKGWGGAVREARAEERRCASTGDDGGDGPLRRHQPLLDAGNRLVAHLMSVSSYPPGKTPMLRANLELISGLIGLFGDPGRGSTGGDGNSHVSAGGDDDFAAAAPIRNELLLNVRCVVDMLGEREGHTGGAHARAQSRGAQAKHTILAGLNLLGVLFARNVPVFASSVPAADELARTIPKVCLSYTQKNAFETGTELLAIALAHVSWLKDGGGLPPGNILCEQCRSDEGEWLARAVTEQLISKGRSGTKRGDFLHAVATIAGSYPRVLSRRLLVTSIEAMQLADASRRGRFLAMLADAFPRGHVPALEVQDLFTRLQPFLPSLLLETEEEFIRGSKQAGAPSDWVPVAQLSALRLVRALVPTMTEKQLGAILGEDDAHSLVGLATPSTYPACREVVYDTLLYLYTSSQQRFSKETDDGNGARSGGAPLNREKAEAVRCALLRGLSDPDDEGMTFDDSGADASDRGELDDSARRGIRRRLLDVFEGGLSDEVPGDRLLYIMRNMFDARTARSWLRFAPYLMLRPAEKAPDYDGLMFKKSLAACEFVDMPVAGGIGTLDARPMEPTFSFASLQSQQQQQQDEGARNYGDGGSYGTFSTDVDVRQAGMVRSTQAYLWSQTQGPGGAERPRNIAFLSQTQSRMLAAGPVDSSAARSVMGPPAPRLPGVRPRGRGVGVNSQAGIGGVGKRFRQSAEGSVSSLGHGESHAMQLRVAAKRERDKAARAKRAVIYRKYRDGELPDIQIKLGDILRPLQHLSMLDGGIAREVFVQVFKAVYAKLDSGSGSGSPPHGALKRGGVDGEDDEWEASEGTGMRAVSLLLQRMLSATKTETGVVACLLAACRAAAAAGVCDIEAPLYENVVGGRETSGRKGRGGGSSQPRRGRLMTPSSGTAATINQSGKKTGAESQPRASEPDGGAIVLNPKLVADSAIASFNFHGGILLLEEAIIRSGRESVAASAAAAAPSGGGRERRRSHSSGGRAGTIDMHPGEDGLGASVEGQQDHWLQLSRLYAALGERDVVVGVSARASRLEGTRQALDCELSGDFNGALKMYRELVRRYDSAEMDDDEGADAAKDAMIAASETELLDWDMHQLECLLQLGDWEGVREQVLAILPEDEEDESRGGDADAATECRRKLWKADPSDRDGTLPYLVRSLLDDESRREEHLRDFLEDVLDPGAPLLRLAESYAPAGASGVSSSCSRLEWLEANMPGELARAFLLEGELGRAEQNIQRCYERFQETWAALHPCADSARREQLRGLQVAVEVEDFLLFADQRATTGHRTLTRTAPSPRSIPSSAWRSGTTAAVSPFCDRLRGLLERWWRQVPSRTLDPVAWWRVVRTHRHDCFTAIEGFLEDEGGLSNQARLDCKRDMMKHRADLSLVAAGAAVAQGVDSVAKELITSYTTVKKQAERLWSKGKRSHMKTELEPGEAGAGGAEDWDLELTLTVVEFQRTKLERALLAGKRNGADALKKREAMISGVLRIINGTTRQHHAAMLEAEARRATAAAGGSGSGGGGDGEWGAMWGWKSEGAAAYETRLRLLTLQGQWLEMEGRVMAERTTAAGGERESTPSSDLAGASNSLTAALASLQEAANLGDRLISAPVGVDAALGVSTASPSLAECVKTTGIVEATGEATLRLAKLCEKLAVGDGIVEAGVGGGGRSREELAALAAEHYLRAMAMGSKDARDHFPRVLFLVGEFPEACDAFSARASSVPEWTFLRWISQMLGVTGRREGPAVIKVLEGVAKVYPRALFYPLLMTKASSSSRRTEGDDDDAKLCRLTAMVFDPSAEAFAEALRGLHDPQLRFCDDMKRVVELLRTGQKDLALKTYLKMRSECLVTVGLKTNSKIGQLNREFAKQYGPEVDQALGKDGQRLDLAKAKKCLDKGLIWAGRARAKKTGGTARLSHLSSWMSDFDSNVHTLEVPGQYGGISHGPPRVSHHSRIISFGSELLVMKSLRMPKRLTMHANDGKDHMFLVKGGEDLRVDERVEQLFEVMNAVMAASPGCRRARLTNKTYQVVPVTPDIGMIEWVQDTRPLKSVIEEGLGQRLDGHEAHALFIKWLRGDVGAAKFHAMFKTASRAEVEGAFAKRCASVLPTDALRRHLIAMAPSPEAFLTCRGGFARSLATLSACSYMLGIGDRHLDNFLLDTTTGTVVGIDFGAAFGVGTTQLGVPELIPFRLTHQFQTLLQPLDSVGLLRGYMISTLQALRGSQEVLLATLDVFLNEPVIDWLSHGAGDRQKGRGKGTYEEEKDEEDHRPGTGSSQPRPRSETGRKIQNSRRKLLGENPVPVLVDDLNQNLIVKKFGSLKKLEEIAWGHSGKRFRAKPELREGLLSVEDQVDCLIDLATDPDVLGRQWIGLTTWV